MKQIVVFLTIMLFVETPSFAESAEDKVPSMSGKLEIMEELGLVDHVDPIQWHRLKKNREMKKESTQKAIKINTAGLSTAD